VVVSVPANVETQSLITPVCSSESYIHYQLNAVMDKKPSAFIAIDASNQLLNCDNLSFYLFFYDSNQGLIQLHKN